MSRTLTTGIAVAVTIAVVALFFVFGDPFNNPVTDTSSTTNAANPNNPVDTQPGATQLTMQDEVVGTGATAQAGDTITVDYTGKFQNGTVFDTSVGKAPFSFTLGAGQVIAGWDQGVAGMKVGGKRMLIVPPSLGYGPNDYGPIPGNSTLVFEVTLEKVTPAGQTAPAPEGPAAE